MSFFGQTVDGKNLVVRLRSEQPSRGGGDRPRFGAGPEVDDNAKLFVSSLPPSINTNDQMQVCPPTQWQALFTAPAVTHAFCLESSLFHSTSCFLEEVA